ncbi:MAG: stage II sporulation protein M [Chthonomonas sp.]|nr:stage II sporulation protein M [Chthonomonas sp.]
MDQGRFVEGNRPAWQRLQELVSRGAVSPKNLTQAELIELVRLYRSTSADFAVIQSEASNPTLLGEVNRLLQEAHAIIYRHRQPPFGEALRNCLNQVARVTRRRAKYILVAILMFFMGIGVSVAVMKWRPDLHQEIIPPEMQENVEAWKSGLHDPRSSGDDALMWGFYASNNPRVALMSGAFAAGTFGFGTFYLMYTNGIMMGGLGYEMQTVNKLGFLLASVSPHGASELVGMFISGAAGLVMAVALINPGRRSRLQSLKHAAPDAMILLVQSMVMMLIAAPFEAFFSFDPGVPSSAKVLVGAIVLSGWLVFWTQMGREPAPAT